MPEIYDNLSPVGLPAIPPQQQINKLPEIDFNDLPQFKAPNFFPEGSPEAKAQDADSMLFAPVDRSALNSPTFDTYNRNDQRKYANSSAFQKLGFNPHSENEDYRYDIEQPKTEALYNSFQKLLSQTGNSFAHTFRQNFDSINAISTQDINDAWKTNPNLKELNSQKEADMMYPTFQGAHGTRWWNFIPGTKGSADFYENFVPQLGFTVGTMAETIGENLLVDFLTSGAAAPYEAVNGSRRIYSAISDLFSLKKGAQLVNGITEGALTVKNLRSGLQAWNMVNAAASEASFEAANNYNETKGKLIQEFKDQNGRFPNNSELAEIENYSTHAGNVTFGLNIPVLLASNWIQFKGIMMPDVARRAALAESIGANRLIVDATNKIAVEQAAGKTMAEIWKTGNVLQKTAATLGMLGRSEGMASVFSEGTEEISQRFISSSASKYASDKLAGKPSVVSAVDYGVGDVLTESGLNEFIGGALGGGLFHGVGQLVKTFADPKAIRNDDGTTTYKENFLNKLGIFSDKFVKGEQYERAKMMASMMNSDDINNLFKEEGIVNMFAYSMNANQMNKFLQKNDLFNFANIKSNVLNRWLYTGLKTGKIDLRMQQLQNLGQLDAKSLSDFMGIEQDDNLKRNFDTYIGYIQNRLPEFEKIYTRESERFMPALKRTYETVKQTKAELEAFRQELSKKYNTEDIGSHFEAIQKQGSAIIQKMSAATDEITMDKIADEVEQFSKDNADVLKDKALYEAKLQSNNKAAIAHLVVEEGRKAAIFAVSDMHDSAERARDLIKELKQSDHSSRFMNIEDLLSDQTIKEELKNQKAYLNNASKLSEMKEEAKAAAKKIGLLEDLLAMHDDNAKSYQKAERIYDYLSVGVENNQGKSAFKDDYVWNVNADNIKKRITNLVKLQRRHQDNLEMFRFMENADIPAEFDRYHTQRIQSFLTSIAKTYEDNQVKEAQTEETTAAETTTPDEPTEVKEAETKTVDRLEELKDKFKKEGALSSAELRELLNIVPSNSKASDLFNDVIDAEFAKLGIKVGSVVKYKGELDTIENIEPDSNVLGKFLVSLTTDPDTYIPAEDVEVQTQTTQPEKPVATPASGVTSYDPDQQETVTTQPEIPVVNRTTVEEVLKGERSKLIPEIESRNSTTGFKQAFLNRLSTFGTQGDYQAFIVLDQAENWPADSAPRKYLEANPGAAGAVLQIVDNSGNEKFDNNFLPSVAGTKLIYSFKNSLDKTKLLEAMKASGKTKIPVDIQSISHGEFIPTDNYTLYPTSELISDVDPTTYDLFVASVHQRVGPIQYSEDGTILINGRFYLRAQGSYIQLSPGRLTDFKIGGQQYNFIDLLGRQYQNREEAIKVAHSLERIIYTDPDQGLSFAVTSDNRLMPVYKEAKRVTMEDLDMLKTFAMGRRMNVTDMEMDTVVDFFYVDSNNQVKSLKTAYKDIVIENTMTNKKAVMQDGVKKIQPVNKYVTIKQDFNDLANTIATTKGAEGSMDVNGPQAAAMNKTDLEIKKADIERRRQEELKQVKPISFSDNEIKQKQENQQRRVDNAKEIISFGKTFSEALDNIMKRQEELNNILNKRQKEETKDREVHQYTKEELEAQPEYQEIKRLDKLINSINDVYTEGKSENFKNSTQEALDFENQELEAIPSKRKRNSEEIGKINAKYDAELAALEATTETKEEPSTKKGLDFDRLSNLADKFKTDNTNNTNSDDLLSVKGISDGTFVSSKETDFIKERFGEQTLKVLANIVNSDAWGLWNKSGITLFADAPSGTGYHEAWHHFSQLFLTPFEKAQLYAAQRTSRLGLSNASDLEIEEQLADDFRKYALSDGTVMPAGIVKQNIFQKIWNFIKSFFGKRDISADKLFSDLYKNKLGRYTPSINNALWGKLNSKVINSEGLEIFDNRKASRYMRYMDSLFGQFMAANKYAYTRLGVSDNAVGAKTVQQSGEYIRAAIVKDFKTLVEEEKDYFTKTGTYSAKAESIEDLEKLLTNFSDVFRHYVRSTKKLKSEDERDVNFEELDTDLETDLENGGTEEEESAADNAGKLFDRAGNELSVIDAATEETKNLIRSLSKVEVDTQGRPVFDSNGKVKLFRNNYGLTETVNFSQVFNNLAILLEGSHSFEEMVNRMKSIENQKKVPELPLLLERLPDITRTNIPLNEVMQISTFVKDFSKFYIPIYTLVTKIVKDGDNTKTEVFFKEETKRTKDLIEKEWTSNFMNKGEDDINILRDENGRSFLNPNYRFNFDFNSQKSIDEFFDTIGFTFSNSTKSSPEFIRTIADKDKFILKTLQKTLNDRLDLSQKIYSPFAALDREFGTSKSERSILRVLSELEAKYTNQNPSMSFRTAKGTLQHGLSLNNWQTNTVYWLNSDNYKQIISNPTTQHLNIFNNPGIKNSVFLNRMFNLNPKSSNFGERFVLNNDPVMIQIGNYNGTSYTDETTGEQTGTMTTDLTDRAKIVMDVNAMYLAGAHEVPRTESSASAFFIKLTNYNTQKGRVNNLPMPLHRVDDYTNLQNDAEFAKIFRGYFEDELASIVNKFGSDLDGYYAAFGPGRFSMFKSILGSELVETLENGLKESMAGLVTSEEKQRLIDATLNKYGDIAVEKAARYISNEAESFKKMVKNQGISKSELAPQIFEFNGRKGETDRTFSVDEVLSNFILNDFILNAEYVKLFSGNTAFYKAYHKRSKGDTSTGIRLLTDPFMLQFLQDTHANTLAGSVGAEAIKDLTTTKTLVIKDDERESNYTKNKIYQRDLMLMNPGMTEAGANVITKPYGSMTVADGQGHATLDFYRRFRIMVGNWQNKDEVAYRKEVIAYRKNNNLYGSTVAAEQETLDEQFLEKWKDVYSYFPPIKMQHNGPLVTKGVFAPVLDKFSIAPLIPSVIKGTTWEGINNDLVKSGVGYTKFKSGTKKYAYPAVDFYNGEWSAKIDSKSHELFTENLKEQIKTGSKMKEESTWGTQMRKLFLANVFSSGVALTPKFAAIYDNYKKLMNNVIAGERSKLYNELGIKDVEGTLTVTNSESFVKTLQSQVDARNLNDNIRDSIQYDRQTGKILYPLEILNNKGAIQDLIAGMIDKRLNKIKINGDMLIQVASTGFEKAGSDFTNATEEDMKQYGTSGLPFYSLNKDQNGKPISTRAMGVKIALAKDFKNLLNSKHPDGNVVGTIERLNQLLKNESWREANREKITMIGYRIPTQGLNSIEFMEVHEFLPEVAGSIVILPAEIVAKSGSDYDIDKMSIFRPSLTDSGELIQKNHVKMAERELPRLEKAYSELRKSTEFATESPELDALINKIFTGDEEDVDDQLAEIEAQAIEQRSKVAQLILDYRKASQVAKKSLTNQIIGLYKAVLSSPEMFTQLITPNDNSLVKSKALNIAETLKLEGYGKDEKGKFGSKEFVDTDIYGYKQNLTKFKQLLSGKRLLGAFALGNTLTQLLQQSGMTLNTRYQIEKSGKMIPHTTTLHLLRPEEIDQLITPENKINYSLVNNVEGIRKQEFFSQLINATVDIAADPYFSALGITNETVGVTMHLLLLGVPFDRVINFINQPSIRYYGFKTTQDPNPRAKAGIKASILGTNVSNAAKLQNLIEAIDMKTINIDDFTDENLNHHLKEYALRTLGYLDTPETTDFQRRIFAHFLKLQDQASTLTNLQRTINFDTAKFLSAVSMQNNLDMREKVSQTNLFNPEAVNKIRTDSLISAFNNVQEGIKVFQSIMPVGMSHAIVMASAEFMSKMNNLKKTQRIKLEKTLNNDWTEFIIKNFATVPLVINDQNVNVNFERMGRQYIDTTFGAETLSDVLLRLKSQMPELSNYTLMKRMLPNLSTKQANMKNVELYRGLDNTTDFQNILIEEYRQLRNYSPNETYGSTITPEQAQVVQNFFRDLKYAAFYQSGFTRSPISFVDVVPYEELADTFKAALETYRKMVADYPEVEPVIINAFLSLFQLNNPKFALNPEEMPQGLESNLYNAEPWRGKNYFILDTSALWKQKIQEAVAISIQRQQATAGNTATTNQAAPDFNAPALPNIGSQVVPVTENFSRSSVAADQKYIYLFTDNAGRTSGSQKIDADTWYAKKYGQNNYPSMTQAVIRGLKNAYPITTMLDDKRTQWSDAKFDQYKQIIDDEVAQIKEALASGQYDGIKYSASNPFGQGNISKMKDSAPKIWAYMNSKLSELGINNNSIANPSSALSSNTNIKQETKDVKKYTNHSGGAQGADLTWDSIGQEFGVTDHRHYRPSDLAGASPETKAKIEFDVTNAARGLGRPTSEFKGKDLVRRNWFQVNGADEVFAVSRIVQAGETDKGFMNKSGKQVVSGGTGWAVEMAIQKGKPVHVFDMTTNGWYKWDVFANKFVQENTPELSPNFAGIGSRELTPSGLQAIRDVYIKTFSNSISSITTTSGQTIASLNISQQEWDALSDEEKQKIKDCN